MFAVDVNWMGAEVQLADEADEALDADDEVDDDEDDGVVDEHDDEGDGVFNWFIGWLFCCEFRRVDDCISGATAEFLISLMSFSTLVTLGFSGITMLEVTGWLVRVDDCLVWFA